MLIYLPKLVTNSIELIVFRSPEYLHFSLIDPSVSMYELEKYMLIAFLIFPYSSYCDIRLD